MRAVGLTLKKYISVKINEYSSLPYPEYEYHIVNYLVVKKNCFFYNIDF